MGFLLWRKDWSKQKSALSSIGADEKFMPKYTDDKIRNMQKITCKIAADYLGIAPTAVSIGMRNNLLPIGFAVHNEERDYALSLGEYQCVDEKYVGKELPE